MYCLFNPLFNVPSVIQSHTTMLVKWKGHETQTTRGFPHDTLCSNYGLILFIYFPLEKNTFTPQCTLNAVEVPYSTISFFRMIYCHGKKNIYSNIFQYSFGKKKHCIFQSNSSPYFLYYGFHCSVAIRKIFSRQKSSKMTTWGQELFRERRSCYKYTKYVYSMFKKSVLQ